MKKSNLVLVAIIVVLAAAVGILAWFNGQSVAGLDEATLVIKVDGQEIGSISLEDITQLGSEEFNVVLRSSGKEPVESTYTGIPLRTVLEAVQSGILSDKSQISVKALDGFAVAYTVEETLTPEHIYLVWKRNGKPLGSKSDGGSGPILIIPRQDQFGQRWCKFVVEVDIR